MRELLQKYHYFALTPTCMICSASFNIARQPLDPAESEMSTKLVICSVNDLFKLCQPLSQCGWTGL